MSVAVTRKIPIISPMNSRLRLLLAAAFGLLFTTVALAQDAAVPTVAGITSANLVTWLTPLLVPLVLAGVKYVMPRLPTWVIPLAAPVLGVAIDYINTLATSQASNFGVAALLGLAGVGLREVKENLKPAPNGGWPVVSP